MREIRPVKFGLTLLDVEEDIIEDVQDKTLFLGKYFVTDSHQERAEEDRLSYEMKYVEVFAEAAVRTGQACQHLLHLLSTVQEEV